MAIGSQAALAAPREFDMASACLSAFQVHWSLVSSDEAGELAPYGGRLLAIWPAPVNHDVCFAAAGFTLFRDHDEEWEQAAEDVLRLVIEFLSSLGTPRLLSTRFRNDRPWYMRLFRSGWGFPLLQQPLAPMLCDSLPSFHAEFGGEGAALRTGNGHFLFWITLLGDEPVPAEFVRNVARSREVYETRLRWSPLLPDAAQGQAVNGMRSS